MTAFPNATITVHWFPAPNATQYRIYRNTTAVTPASLDSLPVWATINGGQTTSWNDIVTPGVLYYYAVVAANAYGKGWLENNLAGNASVPTGPVAFFSANATHVIQNQYVQFTNSRPVPWIWSHNSHVGLWG